MNARMVFLIATPRSGSTMLERMLSSHSAIQGGPEPHLLTPLAHLGYYAKVDAAPYDPEKAAEGLTAFVDALPGGKQDYRDACRAYCDVLYGRYVARGAKTLCLDKTPAYALILPFLTEIFPDAKYVVLTRHPFAIFSSYAHSFFDGDYEEAQRYNPILNRYVPAVAAFLRQDAVPFAHVRYEDLVQDPERWMRAIFDHIGVPFESAAIEYGANPADGSRTKGLGDPIGVQRHARPTTASVAKWVEDLASDPGKEALMRAVADQLADDDLRAWGYPREDLWTRFEAFKGTPAPRHDGVSRYKLQRKAIVRLRAAAKKEGPLRQALVACRKACDTLLGQ